MLILVLADRTYELLQAAQNLFNTMDKLKNPVNQMFWDKLQGCKP